MELRLDGLAHGTLVQFSSLLIVQKHSRACDQHIKSVYTLFSILLSFQHLAIITHSGVIGLSRFAGLVSAFFVPFLLTFTRSPCPFYSSYLPYCIAFRLHGDPAPAQ